MPPVALAPASPLRIVGGGTAFPERTLTNEEVLRELAPILWPGRAMADEQLAFMAQGLGQSIGVERRAWAHRVGTPLDHASEPTTRDLAVQAARAALADANLAPGDVDLVIASTSTPHRMTSTLSGSVGAALGARAACMDVRTGCSAVLFALTTASAYLAAGAGPILVVGSETFSKVIPPSNKMAAISLGDGAGALVVTGGERGRLLGSYLETDGALGRLVSTDGALPPTEEEIARGGYLLSGAPEELMSVIPGKYLTAIEGALGKAGVSAADVDLFVPHQTSAPLIAHVARAAGIPVERTFVNVPRHANVGAAGCIVAVAEARAEGRFSRGAPEKTLLLAAVGGGMSWGGLLLEA